MPYQKAGYMQCGTFHPTTIAYCEVLRALEARWSNDSPQLIFSLIYSKYPRVCTFFCIIALIYPYAPCSTANIQLRT